MAVYGGSNYTKKKSAIGGGGVAYNDVKLHDIVAVPSTLALGDTIVFGAIPSSAVITSVGFGSKTQIDSGGAPTLGFNVGVIAPFTAGATPAVIAAAGLFKSAITTVGRAANGSLDTSTLNPAVIPYQVPTGQGAANNQDQWLVAQVSGAAQTPVAGNLEVWVTYHMEPVAARPS